MSHYSTVSEDYGNIIPNDSWFDLSDLPKIIIIGHQGCGKTSFVNSLLNKSTTTSTRAIESHELTNSFFDLQIIDTPGLNMNSWIEITDNTNFRKLVSNCINLICLFDTNLHLPSTVLPVANFINLTVKLVPSVNITVLLHKHDLIYMGVQKDPVYYIRSCIDSYLEVPLRTKMEIIYTCTSIMDVSILSLFTQIIIPHVRLQHELQNLLVEFVTNSVIQRGFIIDKFTKIIIAAEPSNFTMQDNEFCCRIIDVNSRINQSVEWGDEGYNPLSSTINFENHVVSYREVTDKLVLIYFVDVFKEGMHEYNFECLAEIANDFIKMIKGNSIMTEKQIF